MKFIAQEKLDKLVIRKYTRFWLKVSSNLNTFLTITSVCPLSCSDCLIIKYWIF